MSCYNCGKKLGGFLGETGYSVILERKERKVCDECYDILKAKYAKQKTCEDCAYFKNDYCQKIHLELMPTTKIGIWDFYGQAEKCVHYVSVEEYEKQAIKGEVTTIPTEKGKEKEIIREKEIIKEVIVKIRCNYCDHLYDETLDRCPYCGAKR